MGCSNSKSTSAIEREERDKAKAGPDAADAPTARPQRMAGQAKPEYPASEAFTIPLDDGGPSVGTGALNETLRQPPKRLQQLMQQAAETEPLTLEELAEKQERAEQRRQELLQQKLETIQKTTQMLMREHNEQQPHDPEPDPKEN